MAKYVLDQASLWALQSLCADRGLKFLIADKELNFELRYSPDCWSDEVVNKGTEEIRQTLKETGTSKMVSLFDSLLSSIKKCELSENTNKLAVQALKDFCKDEGITLDNEDEIYVWHWFDAEGEEHVRINTENHQPDGVCAMVSDLMDIEKWWQEDWDNAY